VVCVRAYVMVNASLYNVFVRYDEICRSHDNINTITSVLDKIILCELATCI